MGSEAAGPAGSPVRLNGAEKELFTNEQGYLAEIPVALLGSGGRRAYISAP
jgi:hypothetical protein